MSSAAAQEPGCAKASQRLARFFAPRSLAIVGASEQSFWTRNAFRNLGVLGFAGEIVLVNPRRSTVFDRPCVSSLKAIGHPVDLAYIAAPQTVVESVIDDAAACGILNAVVVAGGFAELGEDGARMQRGLVEKAARHDMIVLGPNCPGFLNLARNVAAYGQEIPEGMPRGAVAVVLQSGALASAVLKFARAHGVGLSTVVCMGNEAVIGAADVLEHLIGDESTRVIAMFIEQIRDGRRFLALAARALAAGKAIVVLKVGRSPEGQRAALAHSGAIAGDEAVVHAALRQAGVVRVDSLEELLITAGFLAQGPRLTGRRMAVVTSSGGACDLIADRASDEGISMPAFAPETAAALKTLLPSYATIQNPLDAASADTQDREGPATVMDDVAEAVARDPNFDFVVYMGFNTLPLAEPQAAEKARVEARLAYVGALARRATIIPLTQTCLEVGPFARGLYRNSGLFPLSGIELGMSAIGRAVAWEEARATAARAVAPAATKPSVSAGVVPKGGPWSEKAGRDHLAACGVPLVPAELVGDAEAAVAAAERLGYPVVLKICAAEIAHKSDIGGVALGLADAAAVRAAYARVTAAGRAVPGATLEGVLVSPIRSRGVELLAGVTVDPTFGATLAVGLGGIWVEMLKDVSLRVLPVAPGEVARMLAELRGRPLLDGSRGGPRVDIDAAAAAIARIADAALVLGPALEALEVNPLWCREGAVEALDVLIVTRAAKTASEGN